MMTSHFKRQEIGLTYTGAEGPLFDDDREIGIILKGDRTLDDLFQEFRKFLLSVGYSVPAGSWAEDGVDEEPIWEGASDAPKEEPEIDDDGHYTIHPPMQSPRQAGLA